MITWAEHHKADPPPPDDDENKEKRTDDIDPWDQEFLKVDQGTLFELILVSMNIAVLWLMMYQFNLQLLHMAFYKYWINPLQRILVKCLTVPVVAFVVTVD